MQAMKKSARSSIAIDKSDDILLVIGRFLLPEGLYVLRLFLLAGAPCLPMPKADKRTIFCQGVRLGVEREWNRGGGFGLYPVTERMQKNSLVALRFGQPLAFGHSASDGPGRPGCPIMVL